VRTEIITQKKKTPQRNAQKCIFYEIPIMYFNNVLRNSEHDPAMIICNYTVIL